MLRLVIKHTTTKQSRWRTGSQVHWISILRSWGRKLTSRRSSEHRNTPQTHTHERLGVKGENTLLSSTTLSNHGLAPSKHRSWRICTRESNSLSKRGLKQSRFGRCHKRNARTRQELHERQTQREISYGMARSWLQE